MMLVMKDVLRSSPMLQPGRSGPLKHIRADGVAALGPHLAALSSLQGLQHNDVSALSAAALAPYLAELWK
jgi:hypothetical protein